MPTKQQRCGGEDLRRARARDPAEYRPQQQTPAKDDRQDHTEAGGSPQGLIHRGSRAVAGCADRQQGRQRQDQDGGHILKQ